MQAVCQRVATVSGLLTVGFSRARLSNGNCPLTIGIRHVAIVVLSKAKLLFLDHHQKNPRSEPVTVATPFVE
jgi:hypothetical protein